MNDSGQVLRGFRLLNMLLTRGVPCDERKESRTCRATHCLLARDQERVLVVGGVRRTVIGRPARAGVEGRCISAECGSALDRQAQQPRCESRCL